jgi:uncharacterized membrane protein
VASGVNSETACRVRAQTTLAYGAPFGWFCYATFELTSLSRLTHWTGPVAAVDVGLGCLLTAVSSMLGLIIADGLTPKL